MSSFSFPEIELPRINYPPPSHPSPLCTPWSEKDSYAFTLPSGVTSPTTSTKNLINSAAIASASASRSQSPERRTSSERRSEEGEGRPSGNPMEMTNESALPPVDSGFGAWSFIVSAFFVEVLLWGFPMSYGTFLEAYLSDPIYSTQPHAETLLSLIGQLSTGLMFCSGPVLYPVLDRYPEHRRKIIWFGGILSGVSLLGASFVTNVQLLVILQGFLYGIGGALMYSPCISFLHEWFVARRGLANGVMFGGTGAGGIIFPLILPPLLKSIGVQKTTRYLAIFAFVLLIPIVPFYRGRLPQTSAYIQGPAPRGLARELVKRLKGMYGWLLIVNIIQSTAAFLPVVWLPTFATDLKLSITNANLALALINFSTISAQLCLGYLADRLNPFILAGSVCALGSAIVVGLWGFAAGTGLGGVLAFGMLYGGTVGGWASLFSAFVRAGTPENATMATSLYGYLLFTRGIGSVMSTPIASALRAAVTVTEIKNPKTGFQVAGGRYFWLITYVAVIMAIASMGAFAGWVATERKKRRENAL